MNMIKRAVNDVINVLTKLNKLNLKEKVYLCVLFIVLYFVVKMVMKQFFVTEHLTFREIINQVFGQVEDDKPTEEQRQERDAVASKMSELKEPEAEEDNNEYRKGGRIELEQAYIQYAPVVTRPENETPQQFVTARERAKLNVERFANRTKLMATLDKK
mgnify:CR=1 FL=1